MKLHANAKTTPRTRELIVRRFQQGWDVASLADALGVSQRTVWKWVGRYREEGTAGLQDRSSAPGSIPHRTCERDMRRIKRLRLRRLPAFQIARVLGLARSTVSAALVRLGLNSLKALEPREPANRYERARPGELLHLDTKKLGRIRGIGHRIHGDRSTRVRGIGWEYVHVCVDDHTRLAYVEVLEDERQQTACGFLERAVRWFASLGVRVERALTDNGVSYKKGFTAVCEGLGIRHLTTRPYRPRTNGKAERFIQTLLREWAYAKPYKASAGRRRALHPWIRYYNHARPHGSLDYEPPISRIALSG